MNFEQLTLEGMLEIQEAESYSAMLSRRNSAEYPHEPEFKPSQKQLKAVYDVMKSGRWMTKAEIAHFSGATEHATSARLSDLREKGIGHEKRKAKDSNFYEYRLLTRRDSEPEIPTARTPPVQEPAQPSVSVPEVSVT